VVYRPPLDPKKKQRRLAAGLEPATIGGTALPELLGAQHVADAGDVPAGTGRPANERVELRPSV